MSSTSLSSWESEAIISSIRSSLSSPESPVAKRKSFEKFDFSGEDKCKPTKSQARFYIGSDSPSSRPMRYESIEEDIEIKTNSASNSETFEWDCEDKVPYPNIMEHCFKTNASVEMAEALQNEVRQIHKRNEVEHSEPCVELAIEVNKNGLHPLKETQCLSKSENEIKVMKFVPSSEIPANTTNEVDAYCVSNVETSVPVTFTTSSKDEESSIMSQDQAFGINRDLQLRRGSLKRQQHVTEDEVTETQSEPEQMRLMINKPSSRDNEIYPLREEVRDEMEMLKRGTEVLGTADASCNVVADVQSAAQRAEISHPESRPNEVCVVDQAISHLQVLDNIRGDSFEMEEICLYEEDGELATLSRARSDSSGFLDGDLSEQFATDQRQLVADNSAELLVCALGFDQQSSNVMLDNTVDIQPNTIGDSGHFTSDCSQSGLVNIVDEVCCSNPIFFEGNEGISSFGSDNCTLRDLQSYLIQGSDISAQNNICDVTKSHGDVSGVEQTHDRLLVDIVRDESRMLPGVENIKFQDKLSRGTNSSLVQDQSFHLSTTLRGSAMQGNWHNRLNVWGNERYMKRLSLPVVQIEDELGIVARHRTSSLRSVSSNGSLADTSSVRRVRSAPHSLSRRDGLQDTIGESCSSFGNMFSFCSDESVVNVGLRKAGFLSHRLSDVSSSCQRCGVSDVNFTTQQEFRHSCGDRSLENVFHSSPNVTSHNICDAKIRNCNNMLHCQQSQCNVGAARSNAAHITKDLQELVEELAGRGLDIARGSDSYFACNTHQQWLHLEASTVHLAVEAYRKQLGAQPETSLAEAKYCAEIPAEVLQELHLVQEIRSNIAAELRRVADLLEEQPICRIASITRQMTVLLREQTRLCQQLEALNVDPFLSSNYTQSSSSAKPTTTCLSEQMLSIVIEENKQLEHLVKKNSQELAEIRYLLKELLGRKSTHLS